MRLVDSTERLAKEQAERVKNGVVDSTERLAKEQAERVKNDPLK